MGLIDSFTPVTDRQTLTREVVGSKLIASGVHQGDFWIQIHGEDLLSVVEQLRANPELQFDNFVDLCGVDYLPQAPRFEVVVHLYSRTHKHRIRIRAQVPDETLTVPSLTSLWKASNWQEREAFDLYGIRFEGHPNLKRILSPPGAEVFPQRKDYPLKGVRDPGDDL